MGEGSTGSFFLRIGNAHKQPHVDVRRTGDWLVNPGSIQGRRAGVEGGAKKAPAASR